MNTRILFVKNGDSDYAATNYEDAVKNDKVVPIELWEKSWEAQDTLVYTDEDYAFDYKALKFGDVDPAFFDFVEDELQDYDVAKQQNFYLI